MLVIKNEGEFTRIEFSNDYMGMESAQKAIQLMIENFENIKKVEKPKKKEWRNPFRNLVRDFTRY